MCVFFLFFSLLIATACLLVCSFSHGLLAGYNCLFSCHFLSLYLPGCVPLLFHFKLWSHNSLPCLLLCSSASIHIIFYTLFALCPYSPLSPVTGFLSPDVPAVPSQNFLTWLSSLPSVPLFLFEFPISSPFYFPSLPSPRPFLSILIFFFFSDSKAMSPHLPSRYRESFCYLSYSLPSWVSPLAGFFILFFNFFAFPLGHPCFYAGMLIVTVSQFFQWQETYRESPWVMGPSQICGAPWRLLLGSL